MSFPVLFKVNHPFKPFAKLSNLVKTTDFYGRRIIKRSFSSYLDSHMIPSKANLITGEYLCGEPGQIWHSINHLTRVLISIYTINRSVFCCVLMLGKVLREDHFLSLSRDNTIPYSVCLLERFFIVPGPVRKPLLLRTY